MPVHVPVLIVSAAPVSGKTGVVVRPLLKSDWDIIKIDVNVYSFFIFYKDINL